MIIHPVLLVLMFILWSTAGASHAPLDKEHLIVPNCRLNAVDQFNVLAKNNQFSLIEINWDAEALTMLHQNKPHCGKFLNVEAYYKYSTHLNEAHQLLTRLSSKKNVSSRPRYSITHDAQVMKLYDLIEPEKIWHTNQHLTSYINRSATQNTGVAAAHWFKNQLDALARESGRQDVSSYFVNTGKKYKQPSVLTVIGKDKTSEAIIIGAHIDTLSGNKPGADDDSSGISVILEIARILLASDIILDHPVYLIAYAAEERGLVGSSYVVQSFINKKIPVKAVMQLDQAGYRADPKDPTIWLLKDYVDLGLTQFLAELLTHYVKIPVAYTECQYACSDHFNWTQNGFSACYPSATTLDNDNPYLHTAEDKLEIINRDHLVNFTKLGLAFTAELGIDS